MEPEETLSRIVNGLVEAALADGMDADLKSLQIDFGDEGVTLRATPETGEVYEAEMSRDELAALLDAEAPEPAEKTTEKPAAPAPKSEPAKPATPAAPPEGEKKAS